MVAGNNISIEVTNFILYSKSSSGRELNSTRGVLNSKMSRVDYESSFDTSNLDSSSDSAVAAPAPPGLNPGMTSSYMSSSQDFDFTYGGHVQAAASGKIPEDFYANQNDTTRNVAAMRILPTMPPQDFLKTFTPGTKVDSKLFDNKFSNGVQSHATAKRFSALCTKPPVVVQYYPFSQTTFYITHDDAVSTANAICDFLEMEVGDVIIKPHKWVIKGNFFLNAMPVDLKVKMFSVDDQIAVEFMRRSGCSLSFSRIFHDCVRCLKENNNILQENLKCDVTNTSSQIKKIIIADQPVPENTIENVEKHLNTQLERIEDTVISARGYKGECLTAMWRLVKTHSNKVPSSALVNIRMVNVMISSMQSKDLRESYVAAILFTAVITALLTQTSNEANQKINNDRTESFRQMVRSGLLEGVLDCFCGDKQDSTSCNAFFRELSSAFAQVCENAYCCSGSDLKNLLNRVAHINHADSTVQGNFEACRQNLIHHLDTVMMVR